mmetsp:Transcript_186/g.363  ORF Transcript_186/g.363 Transcript_186/m.363 type:complete len:389 (+) Transcript_186:1512-2678(+)
MVPIAETLVAVETGHVLLMIPFDDLRRGGHWHIHILHPRLHLCLGLVVGGGATPVMLPAAEPLLVLGPQLLVVVEAFYAIIALFVHVDVLGFGHHLRRFGHFFLDVALHDDRNLHLLLVVDGVGDIVVLFDGQILVMHNGRRPLARHLHGHHDLLRRQRISRDGHLLVDGLRGLSRDAHLVVFRHGHCMGVGDMDVLVMGNHMGRAGDVLLPTAPGFVLGAPQLPCRRLGVIAAVGHMGRLHLVIDHMWRARHRHWYMNHPIAVYHVVPDDDLSRARRRGDYWGGSHLNFVLEGCGIDEEKGQEGQDQQRRQTGTPHPGDTWLCFFHLFFRDAPLSFTHILQLCDLFVCSRTRAHIVISAAGCQDFFFIATGHVHRHLALLVADAEIE